MRCFGYYPAWRKTTHDYFLDSLPITTTSSTTTATPITVQSHIPPPAQPPIQPLFWFIMSYFISIPCDLAEFLPDCWCPKAWVLVIYRSPFPLLAARSSWSRNRRPSRRRRPCRCALLRVS